MQTTETYPELLSLSEACRLLNVHPNTLRNWDNQGLLVATRIGVKGIRKYPKNKIIELVGSKYPNNRAKGHKYKVIDLFSGCGGMSYGFEQTGRFEILAGIDNWQDSLVTFSNNHESAAVLNLDLGNFSPTEIEKKVGRDVDIVIGGPPCQGFSISGKRDPSDPRNKLYQGFVRTVEYFKPLAFVLENVPNLVSMESGKIKDKIISDFTKLGYEVKYKILLASEYGVPQNRRRVVFVGIKNSNSFEFPEPKHIDNKHTCFDALSDLPEESVGDGTAHYLEPQSKYQKLMRQKSERIFNHEVTSHSPKTVGTIALVPDGGNYKDLPEELRNTRRVNIAWTRYNSKRPSLTIDTGHRHHFHYRFNRIPTVRESARLQSFPDNFIFYGSKTSQYKQVGNAVPPLMAYAVAEELIKALELQNV
ncbi:MAG: DNA (cytosine-5-)-methyltransferase [Patescibacteria group bacterium]